MDNLIFKVSGHLYTKFYKELSDVDSGHCLLQKMKSSVKDFFVQWILQQVF